MTSHFPTYVARYVISVSCINDLALAFCYVRTRIRFTINGLGFCAIVVVNDTGYVLSIEVTYIRDYADFCSYQAIKK